MNTITLTIPNISCNHCVNTVVVETGGLEGVENVTADAGKKQAVIQFSPPATEKSIRNLLAAINYPAEE